MVLGETIGPFSGFGAYVVTGNTVLLCEREIATCDALLAQVQ